MSRRSPLGRVLGLGSAKEGVSHWWAQRVSAMALVPLMLWLIVSLVGIARQGGADYLAVVDWVSAPLNTVLLLLLVPTLLYHSYLGVQVVIEDYVTADGLKIAALVLQKFVHAVLAVSGIVAVLRIAFGG